MFSNYGSGLPIVGYCFFAPSARFAKDADAQLTWNIKRPVSHVASELPACLLSWRAPLSRAREVEAAAKLDLPAARDFEEKLFYARAVVAVMRRFVA